MVTKRILNVSDDGTDQPMKKQMRRLPSFATVIRDVVREKSLQNFCSSLEPLLRRVVREEVEHGLINVVQSLQSSKSTQMRIQPFERSKLQLTFSNKLSLPIFTGSRIRGEDDIPLRIFLVNSNRDGRSVTSSLPSPIKIEIVVIDGDFPSDNRHDWTQNEFNSSVVRERAGKRPLLAGEMLLTLREGVASIGDLSFTDNSSWIRSRNFRIGARVIPGSYEGERIKEAMTEAFVVKDHRGELYKKHYPPSLLDKVWRLEKIGKDGTFHRKLAEEGINTVQDFLKLWVVNPTSLRRILGGGMSDKVWEGTVKHARTCLMGNNKFYLYRGTCCAVLLNPICQVAGAILNGITYSVNDLNESHKACVEQQVLEAYENWNSVEEVNGLSYDSVQLQYEAIQSGETESRQRENVSSDYQTEALFQVEQIPNNVYVEFDGWNRNRAALSSYSSSDDQNE